MTFGPGGSAPPPPPIPPEQPPPGWEPPGTGGPTRGNIVVAAIAVSLAVSLAMNAVLALRVKDESDQQQRLRTQVNQLQAELDALRNRDSGGAGVLERLAAAVAQIRGLQFQKAVAPELLTEQQLRARVEEQFRADNPRAEIDSIDAVLSALGLLQPRDDLFDILLAVQTEQVAGYYDTKTKKLVVTGNSTNPSPFDRVLLAHEYVHALTDQHFDLTHLDNLQNARKDDEATAYLTLIEGDATLAMSQYAERFLTPSERRDFLARTGTVPQAQLNASPRVVQESLLFPYQQGVRFVQAIMDAGGLDALNKAYREPPTSTEQILHASKYTGRRDDPTAVDVPDLARAMGGGWTGLEAGGIGEFDVHLIVNEFLPQSDADVAAEGWDGGRYVAARSATGTVVGVLTVWDSESEAREATEALGRWLPARYGNQGSSFTMSGAAGRGWDAGSSGAGIALRSGSRVLLIVGPDRASTDRARGAFPGF